MIDNSHSKRHSESLLKQVRGEEDEEEFQKRVQRETQENRTLSTDNSNSGTRIQNHNVTRTIENSHFKRRSESQKSPSVRDSPVRGLSTSDEEEVFYFPQRPQEPNQSRQKPLNGLFVGQSAADIAREFGIDLSDNDEDENDIDPRELEDAIRMANTLS
jgi:hypothetical protein